MKEAILVLNAGSSSIKFAAYTVTATSADECLYEGTATGLDESCARFKFNDRRTARQTEYEVAAADHGQALQVILDWSVQEATDLDFVAVGHRVVHGGSLFRQPVRVDEAVLAQLKALVPLAPLHQPHALLAIEALMSQRPELPQVACFDTAFHASMPWQEQHFALPRELFQQGVRRYGFHGLSYEYIARILPQHLGEVAQGKVVVAHLGHGASMCALTNLQSVATTMSFTPLDGLPMGTRSGAIDPAVVLYLLASGMSADDISDLLHHRSGLLGLSGRSADMRALLASDVDAARKAVDYFCYKAVRELGSLAAALGGLDALVFTGGIGEHAAPVRQKICQAAAWLGIDLDNQANQQDALHISQEGGRVSVWVVPTDEEQIIGWHTRAMISAPHGHAERS
jgi:acetate kinase